MSHTGSSGWIAGREAGRPDLSPFRTHRAQLRQWAQDNAIHVALALKQRGVNDWPGQRILIHETLELFPVEGPPLTPAVQPFVHDARGLR